MDGPIMEPSRKGHKMAAIETKLRLPEALRAAVVAAAQKNDRSMNAEIVQRLRASLTAEAPAGERAA